MPDVSEMLCWLALVLLIVAVVGHGLWLLAAAILRSIFATPGATGRPSQRVTRNPSDRSGPLQSKAPRRTDPTESAGAEQAASIDDDLAATERQLRRLYRTGALPPERLNEMLDLVRSEKARLRQARTEAAARPAPVEPPTTGPEPARAKPAAEEKPPQRRPAEITDFVEEPRPRPEPPPRSEPRAQPVPQSSRPRRALADLLQAFMEEKNIRWGELVSGILIVGSAIGLVISLWSSLKETIPYFPGLLFMLATAAIHGAGLYTLKRWRLKSTSRGLLIISALLVPLNFLAAIALSQQPGAGGERPIGDPLYLAAVTVGVLGFGAIAVSSARTLMRRRWWPLAVALMGPSIGQLMISRLAEPGLSIMHANVLGLLPLSSYLAAVGAQLWLAVGGGRLSLRRTSQTFLLLSIAFFSLLMPLALLVWRTGAIAATLSALSPSLSLVAATVLGAGLIVHRRITAEREATTRTAGTALALIGAVLMLTMLVLAWPRPELLIAVGLIDCAVLSLLALAGRLPALNTAGMDALGLTVLVAFHVLQGNIAVGPAAVDGRQLLDVLLMGRSGLVLLLFAAVPAGVAAGLRRASGFRIHGESFLWSSAGLGAASVLVALYAGFVSGVDGDLATVVFALAAIATLGASLATRRRAVAWPGSALLFVTFLHALVWNEAVVRFLADAGLSPHRPFVTAALLHATIAVLIALLADRIPTLRRAGGVSPPRTPGDDLEEPGGSRPPLAGLVLEKPLCLSALITTALAVPPILLVTRAAFAAHSAYAFWTSALWLLTAWTARWPRLVPAAQGLSYIAVGFAAAAVCRTLDWWAGLYQDPRFIQAQLGALAVWSMLWTGARLLGAPGDGLAGASGFRANTIAIDRLVLGLVVAGLVGLAALGALPGIADELSAAGEEPRTAIHSLAAGLMLSLIVVWVAGSLLFAALGATSGALAGPAFVLGGVGVLATALLVGQFPSESARNAFAGAHAHAYGVGSWIALAVILAAGLLSLRERGSRWSLAAVFVLLASAPLLIAGRFESETASASALRWSLALLAVIAAPAVAFRDRLSGLAGRIGFAVADEASSVNGAAARNTVLAITLPPIFALSLVAAGIAAAGNTPAGPAGKSLFGLIGPAWSYATPVWLLAAAVAFFAVRDRDERFALASSLLILLGASLFYAMPAWLAGRETGFLELVELLQWNALALAIGSLAWVAGRRWLELTGADRPKEPSALPAAIDVQLALTLCMVGGLAVWAALGVFAFPAELPASVRQIGTAISFAALVLNAAACLWYLRDDLPRWAVHVGAAFATALVPLAAASMAPRNSAENWLAYHMLTAGWVIAAALVTATACLLTWRPAVGNALRGVPPDSHDAERHGGRSLQAGDPSLAIQAAVRWAIALGGTVVLLALRAEWDDPARPWWSTGATAAVALLAAALAVRGRSQPFAHASVLLTMLAATFAWLAPWLRLGETVTPQSWLNLVEANLIAAALAALVWTTVEVVWQRRRGTAFDLHWPLPPVHHSVAGVGLLVATALAVVLTARRAAATTGETVLPVLANAGGWLTCAALALLLIASLWDRTARHAAPLIYVWGLAVVTVALDSFELTSRDLLFGVACGLSLYALLTGLLWIARGPLLGIAHRVKVPKSNVSPEHIAVWLIPATLLLAAAVIGIEFWVVLTFDELSLRLYGATATALLVPAIAALTVGYAARVPSAPAQQPSSGEDRSRIRKNSDDPKSGDSGYRIRQSLQLTALLVAAVAALHLAWAAMPVSPDPHFWLQRTIRLMEVFAAATFVYAVLLVRAVPPANAWNRPIRNAAVVLGGASLVSLFVVLGMEAAWFVPGEGAPITGPQIAVVAVVLVGLVAALISLAVLPGRDPLRLSERGRMAYVYAAEVVASLLFLHVYLSMPGLFRGYFTPYWPFIVMGIAFAGAGVGELFHRLRLRVLAEPLQRTGTFLPLLPAIAFWLVAGRNYADYSTVLFLAGLLYVLLSMWRQSFVYGLAAALAGNAGLWALLYDRGTTVLAQPQLWLIPPALSVLVAAQLNRRRLSETQLTGIRYLCVTIIYVSSTGEMFVAGVGEQLWQPMLLAALSVAGVLAGIVMHVRAFLYLGSSFLLLSMVSMVWHAARHIGHVWPWWAFGIALGLSILAVFGLFEKKRPEVLEMIDRLRQWEP